MLVALGAEATWIRTRRQSSGLKSAGWMPPAMPAATVFSPSSRSAAVCSGVRAMRASSFWRQLRPKDEP